MLDSRQCRAARALLGITQKELSIHSQVSTRAIQDFELAKRTPNRATLQALCHALELDGVVFIARGVSLRNTQELRGITIDPRKVGLADQIETG